MEYFSPALSVNSDMTDEELDKYFATYVPLSNLPTPPPAKEQRTQWHTMSRTTSPYSPELQGMFCLFIHFITRIPDKDVIFAQFVSSPELLDGAHGPSGVCVL